MQIRGDVKHKIVFFSPIWHRLDIRYESYDKKSDIHIVIYEDNNIK